MPSTLAQHLGAFALLRNVPQRLLLTTRQWRSSSTAGVRAAWQALVAASKFVALSFCASATNFFQRNWMYC
jgi:hypothetical protein